MKTIIYKGHKIEFSNTLTGKETVLYDGKVMSSKHSLFGATHVFVVKEEGEDIQYEVETNTRWHMCSYWCIVRRKGEVLYSDR